MTAGSDASPFLARPESSWLASNGSAFAIADGFPVSPGHSLVIPRRVVATWWELHADERRDMWDLVGQVKVLLDTAHSPDGYNVGFNSGPAAGQTVGHLHIHVIPRFRGDVPDPRGGVRWVIPEKANYLDPGSGAAERARTRLVDSADDRVLRLELLRCLIRPDLDRIDLLVSFVMRSGVALIRRQLGSAIDRGATVRILTTDYLGVTDPAALATLLDLAQTPGEAVERGSIEVRAFHDPLRSFHPKAYLFWSTQGAAPRAFVGSNNLSQSGIEDGIEWAVETSDVSPLVAAFEQLWGDPRSEVVDRAWIDAYQARRVERGPAGPAPAEVVAEQHVSDEDPPPTPRPLQAEALAALEAARAKGERAGLVVLATGLGKTWLAAFDSNRPEFGRVLFIAHREEILTQARDVFRAVRPTSRLGFFHGSERDPDAEVVFATVQSLHRNLDQFAADAFDYLVVDEFHHAAADTYRRVIAHFQPGFLLGLTATPERLDGADLLALCGDNLIFRRDLTHGIERGELSPFRYWGVADTVNFRPIPWRNGRFDPTALDAQVVTGERAEAALREWSERAGERTLAFCCSIRHADFMAAFFVERGIASVSLHSQSAPGLRERAVERLERGELRVIFTVDLFNEGVDVPTLDTVLLLRPTQSPVLFLQQLGRGLRTAPGKEALEVVDFVGNHRSFLAPLRTLMALRLGRRPRNDELFAALRSGTFELPPGCAVDYQLRAIELLQELLRAKRGQLDAIGDLCAQLADENGARPSALQVELAGGNVATARKRAGSWFELVAEMGLLSEVESAVVAQAREFLSEVETTHMTRSFKMVLLQAMVREGRLLAGMPLDELAARSLRLVQSDPRLAADVDTNEVPSVHLVDAQRWERYWRKNPVDAWCGRGWLRIEDGRLAATVDVPAELSDTFHSMVAELVEWRLHGYFRRGAGSESGDEAVLSVSHSNGSPIIRFDRAKANVPQGSTAFVADGDDYVGNFVKIALNTATRDGEVGNALPALLRRWFGPWAGWPGTRHEVALRHGEDGWSLAPVGAGAGEAALPFFPSYAVACGAFHQAVPSEAAPRVLSIGGLAAADADEFLVVVRGDSMSGGPRPLRHGDIARMRWTRSASPEQLVGRTVLVELTRDGQRFPALKVLQWMGSGFVLRSTGADTEDIPGTRDMVIVAELVERVDPAAWNPIAGSIGSQYRREHIAPLFGEAYNRGNWDAGHVSLVDDTVLLVTLAGEGGRQGSEYVNRFESRQVFHWTSQNATGPEGKKGKEIIEALNEGRRIHLFVRRRRSDVAFTSCGLVAPIRHEGDRPMTVWFQLLTPLSDELARRFTMA